MANKHSTAPAETKGFTIAEVLITIVIVGTLSAVALPNYFRQVQRSRQNEAAATLAQLLSIVAAYDDDYRSAPSKWEDLSKITAVMTDSGPATAGTTAGNKPLTTAIILPGGNYQLEATAVDNPPDYYEFEATPLPLPTPEEEASGDCNNCNYNVMACIYLKYGSSDVKIGTKDNQAEVVEDDLTCGQPE